MARPPYHPKNGSWQRDRIQGIGIVGERGPSDKLKAGMWTRVGGDMLDAGVLAAAATKTRNPKRLAAIAIAVGSIALLDLLPAKRLTKTSRGGRA